MCLLRDSVGMRFAQSELDVEQRLDHSCKYFVSLSSARTVDCIPLSILHRVLFFLHFIQSIDLPQTTKSTFQVVYHRSWGEGLGPISTNTRSKVYIMVNNRFLICGVGEIRLLSEISSGLVRDTSPKKLIPYLCIPEVRRKVIGALTKLQSNNFVHREVQ